MATANDSVHEFGPQWTKRRVVTFAGQRDTHINTGEDYSTVSLAEIFTMEPGEADKGAGPAFIPSTYHDFDARNHATQREHGEFAALCGDIDKGDHALDHIEQLVRSFVGDAAWLIYSSAHARTGDMRWRVILPLARSLPFDEWHDAQHAFFNFMEFAGVAMDRALDRAGQPVYLPNVPLTYSKTGEPLRDDWGPMYYQRATSGTNAPGLRDDKGALATGIEAIRRKRAEDDKAREILRRQAEDRRAAHPHTDGKPVMAEFNDNNQLASLFELYGYRQSPRNADDWRSPHQTGDTYATRIMGGGKWVSLSASDAAAGVGERHPSGCFGDAYDLFVHYEHGGDHKAAFRTLYQERRASTPLPSPPPLPDDDPGPEPDPVMDEVDPDLEARFEAEALAELVLINPADWSGSAPPARQWRWQDFMPDGQASLLTGAGAAGKSLATQQMATCIALGLPFLGIQTAQTPALYITCEDDEDELHRRQKAICAAIGADIERTRGRLFLLSLQGQIGNELATFSNEGEMTPARRYGEIERTCLGHGIRHVTLDNTAHTFAGNENDRHQVAAFVNLNNRLAQAIGGSVLMVGHPNKAGDSYSGSTAWENQVRARLYLEIPKGEEGAPLNPDMRVLRNEKANYSQRGAEVQFFWHAGAFLTADQMPKNEHGEPVESSTERFENELFLDLLARLTKQRRHVSHSANLSNYAPKVMAGMSEAHGTSAVAFKKAMERLFTADRLSASQPLWKGSNRHPVLGLVAK